MQKVVGSSPIIRSLSSFLNPQALAAEFGRLEQGEAVGAGFGLA